MRPKFDTTGVRTHDLWIITEHVMPLRRFNPRSHQLFNTHIMAMAHLHSSR